MKRNYNGVTQRTFDQAVLRLLETEYGFINSRRVISMIVDDIVALVDNFFPVPTTIRPGWMVFTGTLVTGCKAVPGRSAGSYPLRTLAWPVLTSQDIQTIAQMPAGNAGKQPLAALLNKRIQRVIEHGLNHPDGKVTLTTADLGLMFGRSSAHISDILQRLRKASGRSLPTKGYFFDQGVRPTHKAEIIALYEQGLDEAAIAREANHSQSSVGHYIRDYERVKLLLKRQIPADQIPAISGLQSSVVKAHIVLLRKHQPDLFDINDSNSVPS